MNIATEAASPSNTADSSRRESFTIVFATLLVALVARQVFALWERFDGTVTYDEIQGFGDAYWPMNLFVFGPSFAIGFAAQAVLVWQLGRGRGRIVTWVGAALLLIGGVLFALIATAHALPYDWASNHGILDEQTGRAVMDAFTTAGTGMLLPYIIGTQAVIAVGAVVVTVGARLSKTIPTWVLVVSLVLVLAFFLVPSMPGSPIDLALSFAQVLLWGTLGWFGWRTTRCA